MRPPGPQVVPLGDDLRATDGDPHERAVAGEAERRLVAGLEQLPRMQREVFLLRAQQGFEYEEIAAALGTTPGAARVQDRKSTRLNSSHVETSYAVFCLKKKISSRNAARSACKPASVIPGSVRMSRPNSACP